MSSIANKAWMGIPLILGLIPCAAPMDLGESRVEANSLLSGMGSFPVSGSNFRVSLTDAPAKELKSVFVNIKHVELWLERDGKEARLITGQNFGLVDLMKLQAGVLLPIRDLNIPERVNVKKVRLVLTDGNYAVKTDDSHCSLQTPSAQENGIKINFTNAVTIEKGIAYSLIVDFDAQKSVVIKGNGDCLLKPVLKVASFTKISIPEVQDDVTQPGDDVTGGVIDGNTGNEAPADPLADTNDTGFDIGATTTSPTPIDPDQLGQYYP